MAMDFKISTKKMCSAQNVHSSKNDDQILFTFKKLSKE
jgi:hypothetical protein